MRKTILTGLSILALGFAGCGGGDSDDTTVSRTTDLTSFSLQDGHKDVIDIKFEKRSEKRVRLYLAHPSELSTILIDTSSKGTFHLNCLQTVWWDDGRADYDCSGVGPDANGDIENISLKMTLWTDGLYELNTRYDEEPLWGGVTHTLQHNGAGDLAIVRK